MNGREQFGAEPFRQGFLVKQTGRVLSFAFFGSP